MVKRKLEPITAFVLCSYACGWCYPINAGEILLRNGDALRGMLKQVTDEHIIWVSDTVGELKLKKESVTGLTSNGDFKLRGSSVPCKWSCLRHQTVTFSCADGKAKRVSLLTLQHLIPFDDHQTANFDYGGDIRLSGWRQTGNTETQYWEAKMAIRLRHAT